MRTQTLHDQRTVAAEMSPIYNLCIAPCIPPHSWLIEQQPWQAIPTERCSPRPCRYHQLH